MLRNLCIHPPARLAGGIALILSSLACGTSQKAIDSTSPPGPEREFRAAWVATVVNIDWPSAPGLSTAQQQAEGIRILDSAAALRLNAIVLQVRPQCDALYRSSLEPWSYYLTGTQGKPPDPYYDPLEFWVAEAHKRGLELHAWFNPYRAHLPRGGEVTDSSIVRRLPGLARLLPDGTYWLDPADPRTQNHSAAVIMDVVLRYDIDGVQFDDYFYPYGDTAFPDEESWRNYQAGGGSLTRDDWRREAVNTFIERIYREIKGTKPRVKFGLSPFGIWRPGYPPSIAGFDQYSRLYADARLWLNKGWIDYWAPQLYWPVNRIAQSFPVLLGWWEKENTRGRHIWPGLYTSTMTDERGVDEVQNEVMIIRGMVPDGPGHIHFSMKALLKDSTTLRTALRSGPYRSSALVPTSPWLDDSPPPPPICSAISRGDSIDIAWSHPEAPDVFHWVLYLNYGGRWEYEIHPNGTASRTIPLLRMGPSPPSGERGGENSPAIERLVQVRVSAVDRLGNESARADPLPDGGATSSATSTGRQ
jgi:uncharacterized lipoprotein YddW (UPF0748 family)